MLNKSLRISSYNIRKARGLDQRTMPQRILHVINTIDADVVVLQEADKRLGERKPAIPRDMIRSESDFDLVEISQNQISLGWHGNAVLVRKGLNVADVQSMELPGFEPRGAVRFTLPDHGGLTIVATHLGLLRRNRIKQLHAIYDATLGNENVIVAGDMNEWSKDTGFEPLDERFDVVSPGRSFHASRPVAALDRFAFGEHVDLSDAGVVQTPLAKRASDHLPIWCDVTAQDLISLGSSQDSLPARSDPLGLARKVLRPRPE